MDGQKHGVAEYENQQNPAKEPQNIKTYVHQANVCTKGGAAASRPHPVGASI